MLDDMAGSQIKKLNSQSTTQGSIRTHPIHQHQHQHYHNPKKHKNARKCSE